MKNFLSFCKDTYIHRNLEHMENIQFIGDSGMLANDEQLILKNKT